MTLNDYIIAFANANVEQDHLKTFLSEEIFFSIVDPSPELKDGPLVVAQDTNVKLPTAKVENCDCALFYSSKADGRLSKKFGGMPLRNAMKMVCEIPSVEGMLIQSSKDPWIVAMKEALRDILKQTSSA